jgi:hypothetical protein
MPRDESIPSPSKKGRRGPEMIEDDPSIVSKLDQLAAREGGGMGGAPGGMGGGGGEEQSAQALMQGAQMIMQAAKMNPRLQPIVSQALQILQQGVQGLAGGGAEGGGMEGEPSGRRERPRPPKRERGASEVDQFNY